MRNLVLAASLFLSLSSAALADRAPTAPPHFAAPPDATEMEAPIADRAAVREALALARAANLAAFRAYQKHGVFPNNTYGEGLINVWRDENGRLCAAATIINATDPALAKRTAEQTNFIKLKDVEQGPLMDWILTSGFTQAEVVAIQMPFSRVNQPTKPTVDTQLRANEDARLKAYYATVDKALVAAAANSLEAATDRLMRNPELAAQLVTPVEAVTVQ